MKVWNKNVQIWPNFRKHCHANIHTVLIKNKFCCVKWRSRLWRQCLQRDVEISWLENSTSTLKLDTWLSVKQLNYNALSDKRCFICSRLVTPTLIFTYSFAFGLQQPFLMGFCTCLTSVDNQKCSKSDCLIQRITKSN